MNNVYFSKKKYINDYLNFDWQKYIKNNSDLNYIKTKKEAWFHWLNYGKYENRIIYYVERENTEENIEENTEKKIFDWESYINNYEDLKNIKTKEEAWNHWIKHGKNENRTFDKIVLNECDNTEFTDFDWKTYINNYEDLKNIKTKEEAWNHWIKHGKNENRTFDKIVLNECDNTEFTDFDWKSYINNYEDLQKIKTKEGAWFHWKNHGILEGRTYEDLFKFCLDEFNRIIKEENSLQICDYSLNKIYVKQKYTHCGKHFFGWKSVMNYLLNNIKWDDLKLDKKYYLDEWIEKLLVWGNKLQNTQKLKDIEKEKLKLITFLHCPPFNSYNDELKKDLLLNDDLLLNKNIFDIIDKNKLFDSITFLYVLSLDHKNFIINRYPKYKNKVLSNYHPIDIDNCKQSELFDISNFFLNKNIYHIGWWLRNFTTFFNFTVPADFNKTILVKKEFQPHFDDKFLKCALDKNIDVVYELIDEEYVKIFNSSCIFCHLADCVANNIVLECIKYNTPIIINRLPSIEEYLGTEYPLFFNDETDLEILMYEEILTTKIIDASIYLKEMNKTHLTLETFSKKINYDINKLQPNNDSYKLTWLYYLNNKKDKFEKYINDFNSQNNKGIKLIIINSLKSKNEILQKYVSHNITVINAENLNNAEIYTLINENLTTEYVTIKKYNIVNNKNYSDLCINYLDKNHTFDIIFFKNISCILSDLSDDLSDLSDDFSDVSDNLSGLSDDFSDVYDDLSDVSDDLSDASENLKSCKVLKKGAKLLKLTQIQKINVNNSNMLWRKSINYCVTNFDNNFLVECYKNHMNIVEIV